MGGWVGPAGGWAVSRCPGTKDGKMHAQGGGIVPVVIGEEKVGGIKFGGLFFFQNDGKLEVFCQNMEKLDNFW